MCSVDISQGAEVAALSAATDRLAQVDPGSMADAELSEAIVAMSEARSRIEAVETLVTAVWDARMVWADDKARSGASWIARRCRIPLSAARSRIHFCRRLREMPITAAAAVAGRIGIAHAKRLERASRRSQKCFARDEEMLVGHAEDLRFHDFERAVTYWEQFADPDGSEDDAKKGANARALHMSQTLDGTWVIDGVGDAIRGTIIHNVLAAIENELFKADWAEARARLGDGAFVSLNDLARTPAQRRFDALVEMATRAASVPKGATRPRPLFTALVDYPTLAGRVVELSNRTVLTPGELVPWLSEADIERVVFGGASRVMDVGARQRLFTGATRRAVEVRDRTCTGFGCHEPPERCDVDHVVPYTEGGLTIQSNGRLFCPQHHPGRRKQRRRPEPDPPA